MLTPSKSGTQKPVVFLHCASGRSVPLPDLGGLLNSKKLLRCTFADNFERPRAGSRPWVRRHHCRTRLGPKHPFQELGGLRQRLVGVADDAAQVDEGVDLTEVKS